MEFLKELFGGKELGYEAFAEAVGAKGYKLADLSKGDYVAKGKLKDEIDKNKALSDKIKGLEESAGDAEEFKKKYEELKEEVDRKEREAAEQLADKELTDSIVGVFGDRKFTSEYVKRGLIEDMKSEIAKPENKGKGYAELFEGLTKDKEGIFASENPAGAMGGINPPSGGTDESVIRAVMGLK